MSRGLGEVYIIPNKNFHYYGNSRGVVFHRYNCYTLIQSNAIYLIRKCNFLLYPCTNNTNTECYKLIKCNVYVRGGYIVWIQHLYLHFHHPQTMVCVHIAHSHCFAHFIFAFISYPYHVFNFLCN